MSHFTYIQTQFRSREALVKALYKMGYTQLEEGCNLGLYGYLGDLRPQTADIVIRRKYLNWLSNDIGFKWQGDHYDIIISDFDRAVFPNFVKDLQREYAYYAVIEMAREKGFVIESEAVDEQGQVRIVLGRWV